MGVCYYLYRPDNKTCYDLGKSYGWGDVFGNRLGDHAAREMILNPCCAKYQAEILASHLQETAYWKDANKELPYFTKVCEDIAKWSEGKPFLYLSENAGQIEDVQMEGYPDYTNRDYVTGTRFWKDDKK